MNKNLLQQIFVESSWRNDIIVTIYSYEPSSSMLQIRYFGSSCAYQFGFSDGFVLIASCADALWGHAIFPRM